MAGAGGRGRGVASLLVPLGAVIAGACFFLPWVRVLRVFGAALVLSGPRIGGGLWLVPGIAAAILLAHFAFWKRRRLRSGLVAVGAVLGVLLCFAVIARLHHRHGFLFVHLSAATLGIRPGLGWAGSLLGFFVTFLPRAHAERARPPLNVSIPAKLHLRGRTPERTCDTARG